MSSTADHAGSASSVRRLLGDAMAAPLRLGSLLGQAVLPQPPVAAGEPLPVSYNFFAGIGPEIANPGGALPGANRWDDKPSSTHPIPVVLVHGTGGGGQTNWGTYVPLLTNEGYSVFTLTYGALPGHRWPLSAIGGMARIEESAAELGQFIDRVLASTGAEQVDIVGHSQGTLMPNYYARFGGGGDKIRKYVSLAPMWHGTSAFGVDLVRQMNIRLGLNPIKALPCHAAAQMAAGSDFIAQMNSAGGPYVSGIEYTNISTIHDEFVVPYTSGQVRGDADDNVTNIVVQDECSRDHSDHLGIAGSTRGATYVLNALDPANRRDVPCMFVPPFFG